MREKFRGKTNNGGERKLEIRETIKKEKSIEEREIYKWLEINKIFLIWRIYYRIALLYDSPY